MGKLDRWSRSQQRAAEGDNELLRLVRDPQGTLWQVEAQPASEWWEGLTALTSIAETLRAFRGKDVEVVVRSASDQHAIVERSVASVDVARELVATWSEIIETRGVDAVGGDE